jgi:hypothetical protein
VLSIEEVFDKLTFLAGIVNAIDAAAITSIYFLPWYKHLALLAQYPMDPCFQVSSETDVFATVGTSAGIVRINIRLPEDKSRRQIFP